MPDFDLWPLMEALLTSLSLFAMGWWPCAACSCKCECCSATTPGAYQVEFSGVTQGYHSCDQCELFNGTFELTQGPANCCQWELSAGEGAGVFPCDEAADNPDTGFFPCKLQFNLFCSDDSSLYVASEILVFYCSESGFLNIESGWTMSHDEQPINCTEFSYALRNVASGQTVCDWNNATVTVTAL